MEHSYKERWRDWPSEASATIDANQTVPIPADIDLKYKRFADDRIRYFRAASYTKKPHFLHFQKKEMEKWQKKKTLKIKNMN